ncbi:MAG TPA: hypothetical protein VMU26_24575 [Candidatus Polarisedimenticolia bacterium]|nr:hypothetical protein [Candidatus Polarisedimenticolia bacterium]
MVLHFSVIGRLLKSDISTTFNIYRDAVTNEMNTASCKVAELVFQTNGAQPGLDES